MSPWILATWKLWIERGVNPFFAISPSERRKEGLTTAPYSRFGAAASLATSANPWDIAAAEEREREWMGANEKSGRMDGLTEQGEEDRVREGDGGRRKKILYRDRLKGLYMVARNFFLLLLNCSAWPCLGFALQILHAFYTISVCRHFSCSRT